MEQDEKFENQLNLALDLSEEERERSKDLDAGYDKETDQWEIIFRYAGTLDTIRWSDTTRIEPLSMGYAIAYIKEDELEAFGANEQVMHYGIKRSKEVRLNHFLTEISIQKKKSIKYCTQKVEDTIFGAEIDLGMEHM